MRHVTRTGVLGLLIAITAGPSVRGGAIGSFWDLGTLTPRGISNSGQVVGLIPEFGTPFLTDGKTGERTEMTGRGYVAISQGGTIASRSTFFATIRQADGTFREVGALSAPYSPHSQPFGVNDQGTVVGFSKASMRDNHAFASTSGPTSDSPRTMTDLGTLGGKNSGATAVNNQGTIVGQADNGQFGAHAFSVESRNQNVDSYDNAFMQDLGTLGGKNSTALAVNESGQVVGASNIRDDQSSFTSDTTFGSNEAVHAFLYDPKSTGSLMTDLGTLPDLQTSVATDINSLGQVVGYASDAPLDLYHFYNASQAYGNARAFLYEDGKLSDLNDLLPLDSGWILRTALGINDSGQIVGSGLYNGESRGYLFELGDRTLTATAQPAPVPEPTTLALFGMIAAGALARHRKRA